MSSKYRRAEYRLYHHTETVAKYQATCQEYDELRASSDVHAQRYTEHYPSSGQVHDPAGDYVNRLMNLERRIKLLRARIDAVENVRIRLRDGMTREHDERSAEKLQVMESVYFDGVRMSDLAHHLGKNERTLYRRRRELVYDVMGEWEEVRENVRHQACSGEA